MKGDPLTTTDAIEKLWNAELERREREAAHRQQTIMRYAMEAIESFKRLAADPNRLGPAGDLPRLLRIDERVRLDDIEQDRIDHYHRNLIDATGRLEPGADDLGVVLSIVSNLAIVERRAGVDWPAVWHHVVRFIFDRRRPGSRDESKDRIGYTWADACRLLADEVAELWDDAEAEAEARNLTRIADRLERAFDALGPPEPPISKREWMAGSDAIRTLREATAATVSSGERASSDDAGPPAGDDDDGADRVELPDSIGNAELAEQAGLKPKTVSRQIRGALSKAGKAVRQGGPGHKRKWTREELQRAYPNLPKGELKKYLRCAPFERGAKGAQRGATQKK